MLSLSTQVDSDINNDQHITHHNTHIHWIGKIIGILLSGGKI